MTVEKGFLLWSLLDFDEMYNWIIIVILGSDLFFIFLGHYLVPREWLMMMIGEFFYYIIIWLLYYMYFTIYYITDIDVIIIILYYKQ